MIVFENQNWLIDRIVVGELMVNSYIALWKYSRMAGVIDPGAEPDRILRRVRELGGKISVIINTHGHGDHIGGNGVLARLTEAPIVIGRNDATMLADAWLNLSAPFGMPVSSPVAGRLLGEGDEVTIGEGRLRVTETPGHTTGGITLVGEGFAFVGDLIFSGSIGRTDFPSGSMELLLKMIREKILTMSDLCFLLPGHGEMTTVGKERANNPFLQDSSQSSADW